MFLPQASQIPEPTAEDIFRRDMEGLDWSEAVVAVMDGSDPDSGTAWECGYAYARGKPIVTFRSDFRKPGEMRRISFNVMLWVSADAHVELPLCSVGEASAALVEALSALPDALTGAGRHARPGGRAPGSLVGGRVLPAPTRGGSYHAPMKIGLVLPMAEADGPGAGSWPRIRDLALLAEAGGIDSLWVYDHLVFRMAGEAEDGIHEAWTLLSALAAVTERAELGTIVLGTGFRPPALTAKMAATLDEIANGRLILGLGTGWHEPEYRAFGYPFDHRAGRFEEALGIIVPLLRGERVTLKGRWHDVDDAVLIPAPPRPARLPGTMPILIAAKGERVLRLTARWADAWNAAWFGFPDERFAQRRADLVTACEAEGRDPATVEITAGITIDNQAAAGGRSAAPAFLPSDPDVIARALDAWRDLGVGHVQVDLRPADERTIEVLLEARARHRGEEVP